MHSRKLLQYGSRELRQSVAYGQKCDIQQKQSAKKGNDESQPTVISPSSYKNPIWYNKVSNPAEKDKWLDIRSEQQRDQSDGYRIHQSESWSPLPWAGQEHANTDDYEIQNIHDYEFSKHS